MRVLMFAGVLVLALAQPVAASEDFVFERSGSGYAQVTMTVPEGWYGFGVAFENRRDRPYCKVRGFRVVGLYSWPFARRVQTWAYDATLLHLDGTHQINIRTNCAWTVRLWEWLA